jgi:hypothetical protein
MDTDRSNTAASALAGEEKIGWAGKVGLCLFVLVFLGFGVLLAGDLLSALWR